MLPTLPACALRTAAKSRPASTTIISRLPFNPGPSSRSLSTTPVAFYRQPRVPDSTIPIPSVTGPALEIPPYPFGPRQVYHQSNTGLYGSARIRFGNKVSERNEIKTRRAWRPNVHHKRLWSEALSVYVRTRVTTRVLRTIDKVGGLDNYLLGTKPARVRELGPWGWRLRWRIMQSPALREKLNAQREQLGLDPVGLDVLVEAGDMGVDEQAAATLLEETSRMLDNEEEFTIGEEFEAKEEQFMREEKPKKA